MKKLSLICMLVFSVSVLYAAGIGVNLTETTNDEPRDYQSLTPEEVAGLTGYEAANWNNICNAWAGQAVQLMDDSGTADVATITFESSGSWGDGSADTATTDGKLAFGYFDDSESSEGVGVDITVDGITYPFYTVIVYYATDNYDGTTGEGWAHYGDITVNGTAKAGGMTHSAQYMLDTFGTPWVEGENALVFEDVSGSTLNIQGIIGHYEGSERYRASVTAFQVIRGATDKATAVSPELDATLVSVNTSYDWDSPYDYDASKYDLYVRAVDPNFADGALIEQTGLTDSEHTSQITLEHETQYFWRVDSYDGETKYEGKVWSFTTLPADPIVTTEPQSVTIPEDTTLGLTFEALNGVTYAWYLDTEPQEVDTNDPGFVDVGTPVSSAKDLSIDNFNEQQEGYYYCKITNNADVSRRTAYARVLTQRLIANWDFEDTLIDNVSAKAGVYSDPNEANDAPVPVFVEGGIEETKAFSFDDNPFFVKVQDTEYFNFTSQGYSVAAWVKADVITEWTTCVSKGGTYWIDVADDARLLGGVTEYLVSDVVITEDDNWHYFVMTFDPETDVVTCYADGVSIGTMENAENFSQDPVLFGAAEATGRGAYQGLLDDVSIWTYPLDKVTVADMYTTVSGTSVCVDKENLDYDFNNDCEVNLEDFATFAGQWLNCNIYPNCYQ